MTSPDPARNPWERYKDHPLISDRRDLPRMRREWMGDYVCLRYVRARGNYRKHTDIGFYWGFLEPGTRDDQIGIKTRQGHKDVHYTRVTEVWNLSRTNITREA